ncbi:MAG: hypothetical protein ABFD50_21990 [Smithella sp.]
MGEGSSFEELKRVILLNSVSKNWETAKLEWNLDHIEQLDDQDDFEQCVCFHDIKELCFIFNSFTKTTLMVGNVCVNNFLGIDTESLFQSLKRINKDPKASPSPELAKYALKKEFITLWEHNFYEKHYQEKDLTNRQIVIRLEINEKILKGIRRSFKMIERPKPCKNISCQAYYVETCTHRIYPCTFKM